MGQYATVVWSEGDEVTSIKLEQMAQNEQWLKDNIIVGNMNWIPNALGAVTEGREPGVVPATKLEVVEYRYDSQVPVKYYDFTVKYPPVFTQPPVTLFSIYDPSDDIVVRRRGSNRTDQGVFRLWDTRGLTKTFVGDITVLLIGI